MRKKPVVRGLSHARESGLPREKPPLPYPYGLLAQGFVTNWSAEAP